MVEQWDEAELITKAKLNSMVVRRYSGDPDFGSDVIPATRKEGDLYYNKADKTLEVYFAGDGGRLKGTRVMNFIGQQNLHYSVPNGLRDIFKHNFIYIRGLCEVSIITRVVYKNISNTAGELKVIISDGNGRDYEDSKIIDSVTAATRQVYTFNEPPRQKPQVYQDNTFLELRVQAQNCEIFHIDIRGY